jgi:GDPmannose 4,6-dehydratase
MLQHETPEDFVVATGEAYSVRDFLIEAFGLAGLDWQDHVEIDPRYFRPTEVDILQGDASKMRAALGWTPRTSFRQLVRMMIDHDTDLAARERTLANAGYHRTGGGGTHA